MSQEYAHTTKLRIVKQKAWYIEQSLGTQPCYKIIWGIRFSPAIIHVVSVHNRPLPPSPDFQFFQGVGCVVTVAVTVAVTVSFSFSVTVTVKI